MRKRTFPTLVISACIFAQLACAQERGKPHVNLAVIGHEGHGKTTLTAAITKVLHNQDPQIREVAIEEIANPDQEKYRGMGISVAHVEFATSSRHYALADFPTHNDFVKAIVSGAVRIDGAILVVSAADGPMPQTRDAIQLVRQAGVPRIAVFLNKIDMAEDAELRELVMLEIRELLNAFGFSGEETPIIAGSALRALTGDAEWQASIISLLTAVDEHIPVPASDREKPFLMPVEDVFSIAGRGTVATGRVERGSLAVDDDIEILGLGETRRTKATGIEMFRKRLDRAEAGDNVGIVLADVESAGVERGQVLASAGSIRPVQRFQTMIYLLARNEGGRATPVTTGYRPQFYFRTADVTGVITLPENTKMVMPGDHTTVEVELVSSVALEMGTRFAIREGGRTVGAGIVTEISE